MGGRVSMSNSTSNTESVADEKVSSFKIGSRVWKIGDPIHSIGTAAVEKSKMLDTFGAQFETARVEGVFLGRGDGKKYRIKWTNLSIPCEIDYGAGHSVLKDPSVDRPQKQQKIVDPASAIVDEPPSVVGPNGNNESPNRIQQEVDIAGGAVVTSTRASQASSGLKRAERKAPGDLPHALFSARAMKVGGSSGEGRCHICAHNHASGVCKTCSTGLDTPKPKLFWICYPGSHGRNCYCKHMYDVLRP
jgi:hypothetical protein